MVTVSTSPATYHHGNLRDALLAAGLEALEGPEGKAPSLRELARAVGVSPTAVYRHFPDKHALDQALANEGLKLLGQEQAAAARKVGGGAAGFAETGRTY
ncbi:MAG: TetR/AcrR family transcriptional regulator, partial [Erythrobacter sp.]